MPVFGMKSIVYPTLLLRQNVQTLSFPLFQIEPTIEPTYSKLVKIILFLLIFNYNEHTQGQATSLEKEANLVAKIERISNLRRVDRGKA